MTEISIKRQGDSCEVDVKGHAGFGELGTDIVCAGISTLTFALLNRLKSLNETGLIEELSYIQGNGEMCITFKGESLEARASLETIEIGFLMLAENFPENIFMSGEK